MESKLIFKTDKNENLISLSSNLYIFCIELFLSFNLKLITYLNITNIYELLLVIRKINFFCYYVLFSGSKVEDAVECYQRAANMFKMAKKWGQAGNAFCEAAQLHAKAGSRHDAATNYVDGANCYKKSDPNGNISNSNLNMYKMNTKKLIYEI